MNENNGVKTIGIVGAIIVVFSLSAFFLLDVVKVALNWWGLAFLLLSELVFCFGLIGIRSSSAGYSGVAAKSGITTVLTLYFLATLVSILSIEQFKDNPNTFILVELGIIALFAVIAVLILSFARRISDSNGKIAYDRRFMETCEKRVYALMVDSRNKEYEKNLSELFESIKYSDKIGESSVDQEISAQITALENALNNGGEKDGIINIFDEVSAKISRRKIEISESKRGGF